MTAPATRTAPTAAPSSAPRTIDPDRGLAASSWWARLRRRLRAPRKLTFTREGRLLTILAIAVGLAAVNTGNNLLYLLLGWVLSFIIASGILSELTLRGLKLERRPPPRIHAGQPFLMELSLENQKPKAASYSIEVEDMLASGTLDKRCYFLKVPPGKVQRTSYRHTFLQRGRYAFAGMNVATKFPFSLFRKSREIEAADEVVVLPALIAVAPPPSIAESRGAHSANRLGRRGEFFGLREYRPGDDRRDVHWRSSARSGRLMVREFEDERAREVTLIVDQALPAALLPFAADRAKAGVDEAAVEHAVGAVERAISTTASLALAYLQRGWVVGVCARGLNLPADGGPAHEGRILRALALLPWCDEAQPFPPLPPGLRERVLVVPRDLPAAGRPTLTTHRLEA